MSKFKRMLDQVKNWKKEAPKSIVYKDISHSHCLRIDFDHSLPFALIERSSGGHKKYFFMKKKEAEKLLKLLKEYLEEN